MNRLSCGFISRIAWVWLLALPAAAFAQSDDDLGLTTGGGSWGYFPAATRNTNLPNVLLIGDSILNGYHSAVISGLSGKANVDYWMTGQYETDPELPHDLRVMLAQHIYDAIHFNIGLHGWPPGRILPGEYTPAMIQYVDTLRLGSLGGTFVWASTTPIVTTSTPYALDPTDNPTIVDHNTQAAPIMNSNGIPINDLYTLMSANLNLSAGDRFHWTSAGYQLMAPPIVSYTTNALRVPKIRGLSVTGGDGTPAVVGADCWSSVTPASTVTLFYGPNDLGPTNLWPFSQTTTSSAPGRVSFMPGAPNTRYVGRSFATNAFGNLWWPYPVVFGTAQPAGFPFTETFEDRSPGPLGYQNGWVVPADSGASVQGSNTASGAQAAQLEEAQLSRAFVPGAREIVLDVRLQPVFQSGPPPIPADASVVLWVNTNGMVACQDGANVLAFTNTAIAPNTWIHFVVHSDYTNRLWSLEVNGTTLATNLNFYSTAPRWLNRVTIQQEGGPGYVDDLSVAAVGPLTPDPAPLVWSGIAGADTNGNWDLASASWRRDGSPTHYTEGDAVQFDDTGSVENVTNTVAVSPGLITVNNNVRNYVISGSPISGGTALLKSGNGSLTLAGTNTYTGGTTLNQGVLRLGDGLGRNGTVAGNLTNNASLIFANPAPQTYSGSISGTGSLTLNGPGTLTFDSPHTYTGATVISAGTLALSGGTNLLPAAGVLQFSGTGTLWLAGANQTLANLSVAIGTTATFTGTGVLTLGANNFLLGNESAAGNTTNDLSGLNTFNFIGPTRAFQVTAGLNATASYSSMLRLAATNQIAASTLTVGGVGSANIASASSCAVALGQNTVLNSDTNRIGYGRNAGSLAFRSGLVQPTLTLRGADGLSPARSLTIGEINSGGQSFTRVSTLDTSAGVLDAWVDTMMVAYNFRGNGADTPNNAFFVMGAGTLTATNLVLAQDKAGSSGGYACSGTMTVSNGTVRVGTLTLGNRLGGLTVSGTCNLNGGALLQAQSIAPGAGTATRTFNWNDGTIGNYDPSSDLTIASGLTLTTAAGGSHAFNIDAGRTATVSAVIAGTGWLTKTGAGTVVLNATNTFSGSTIVSNGTLVLNGWVGTNTLTVTAGATLGGTGTVRGATTVLTNGTLAPGANGMGTLTISNTLTLFGITHMELGKQASSRTNDLVRCSGAVTYGGSLVLMDVGPDALVVGDKFTLFNAASRSGSFAGIAWPALASGLGWTNKLALDGSIEVVTSMATNPTNIVVSMTGGQITLWWPPGHTGWELQYLTNSLSGGLAGTWYPVAGSPATNQMTFKNNPAIGTVFYRLKLP